MYLSLCISCDIDVDITGNSPVQECKEALNQARELVVAPSFEALVVPRFKLYKVPSSLFHSQCGQGALESRKQAQ